MLESPPFRKKGKHMYLPLTFQTQSENYSGMFACAEMMYAWVLSNAGIWHTENSYKTSGPDLCSALGKAQTWQAGVPGVVPGWAWSCPLPAAVLQGTDQLQHLAAVPAFCWWVRWAGGFFPESLSDSILMESCLLVPCAPVGRDLEENRGCCWMQGGLEDLDREVFGCRNTDLKYRAWCWSYRSHRSSSRNCSRAWIFQIMCLFSSA